MFMRVKQPNHEGRMIVAGARRVLAGGVASVDIADTDHPHPFVANAVRLLKQNPDAHMALHNTGDEYHLVNQNGFTIRTVTV